MTHHIPRAPIRILVLALLCCSAATPVAAERRFIVRADDDASSWIYGATDRREAVWDVCRLVGCHVQYGLDGGLQRLFLVTTPDWVDPDAFVALLPRFSGVEHAEIDALVQTKADDAADVPPALLDAEPVGYFGSIVRGGYVRQPARGIVGIEAAHAQYGLTGRNVTVAVIDTGVDPTHPALEHVLLEGYDFTRGTRRGSEMSDVDQSTM